MVVTDGYRARADLETIRIDRTVDFSCPVTPYRVSPGRHDWSPPDGGTYGVARAIP